MDELIERIRTAMDKMWEEKLTANTVVLNGKKYGCLFELGFTPSICGLTAELGNLPDNMDFIVQHRYPEPEPATNGDRIRNMSDEELAKAKILCPYTAVDMDMCEKWITSGDTRDCAACALDWLKQEAPHG